MAQMNFGGVIENVMTREEFPLEKAREVLKDETIAVIGYGVQGPGQSLNLRDNGFNVIVGQRQGKTYDKAVADGWVPGETLFSIEEACQKATIIMCLLSDAAVISVWPTIKPCLTAGKALYFSHGFAITWNDRTGVVPPTDVDVIMVAPKGSGTSLRTMFMEGRGLKLDDYLKFSNKTIEDLRTEYKDSAAENVRADLVLDAVATAEGIEVTPDDMNREIFIMAQNFGADPKEVWDIIAKEGRVAMLAGSVARKKAARFIIDNAKGAEAAK